MKQYKLRNQYNKDEFSEDKEINDLPSQTIPNQTMGLRELLTRFGRGLPITGEKFPMFHGEDTPPDLTKMDLADVETLRDNVAADIKAKQEQLQSEQQRIDKELNDRRQKEQFQRWKEEEDAGKQQSIPQQNKKYLDDKRKNITGSEQLD